MSVAIMKACWLAVAISIVAGICSAKRFEILHEGSKDVCILLDVEFNIEVNATANNKVIATRTFTSEFRDLQVKGQCVNDTSTIGLFFFKNTFWAVEFLLTENHHVDIFRVFRFVPAEIFGGIITDTYFIETADPRQVNLKDANHSYLCEYSDKSDYITTTPVTRYKFSVNAIVSKIQTQGIGLKGSKYGKAEVCPAPVSPKAVTIKTTATTAVTPVTHVTKVAPVTHSHSSTEPITPVTHVPPTQVPTPGPKAPVNKYAVKEGNETCIAMDASLSFEVTYQTVNHEFNTVIVNVPQDARSTGNCQSQEKTQTLEVKFFNDWVLTFTFNKDSEPKRTGLKPIFQLVDPEPSYRISNLTLFLVVDERIFPDTLIPAGHRYTVAPDTKTSGFLTKSAKTAYYRCDSQTTFQLNYDVKVMTSKLRFKAFNTDDTTSYTGDATVCASDKYTKSTAGIIAGVTIVVIVAIAVTVLFVLRVLHRRQKSYQNLQ